MLSVGAGAVRLLQQRGFRHERLVGIQHLFRHLEASQRATPAARPGGLSIVLRSFSIEINSVYRDVELGYNQERMRELEDRPLFVSPYEGKEWTTSR